MAIDFPNAPATSATYTVGNKTWIYDGTTWNTYNSTSFSAETLPGTTIKSTVTGSSLTSVGNLTTLTVTGRLGVGATLTSGAMAQIVNTTAADKAFVVKGATLQSGSLLDIQNSSGTSLFAVTEIGNLNVASNVTTGDSTVQIGTGRSGNGYAYVDLVGDATYTDYGLRLIRNNNGANANSQLLHRGTGDFQFNLQEAAALTFSTAGTERMRITSAGNIGIGTSSPSTALDVVGTTTLKTVKAGSGAVAISGATYASAYGTSSYTTTTPHGFATGDTVAVTGITPSSWNRTATITILSSTSFYFILFNGSTGGAYSSGGTATGPPSTLYVDLTNDRVGIGTSSPATKLDVVGTVTATAYTSTSGNQTTNYIKLGTTAADSDATLYGYTAYGAIRTTCGYGVGISWISNGGSGAGGFTPNAHAVFLASGTVSGDIRSNSNTTVSYNTSSDYRLKENISEITDGIERIRQLRPVKYQFKDPNNDTFYDGFLAHEVQPVAPYAISGEKDAVGENGLPMYQQIDTSWLVGLLAAGIKDLDKRLTELEGLTNGS